MIKSFRRWLVLSLRQRLLLLVSIATLLILGLAAPLSYRQASHEVQELMDGQMSNMAQLMLAQAQQDAEHLSRLPELLAAQRGMRIRKKELTLEYQIGRPDGTVLARSPEVPAGAFTQGLGFSTVMFENQPWRNLILETTDGRYRIQVAQSVPKRNKEALEIARKTVLPLGVIFPLLLAAIYLSVRRGLRPLDRLAGDVLHRSPENMTLLDDSATPNEALPLVRAINRLLFRLSASLESERRFTSDAAHELRTPLAAACIQAQVAMLSEATAPRNHALSQTLAGIDRATRLVEQMLRLARLDPLAQLPEPVCIELTGLIEEVVAGFRDMAPGKTIDVEIDEPGATIDGDPALLEVLLRNLVDNAQRYSSTDSRVIVILRRDGDDLLLGVLDNGPGVSAEELPRLMERFYRGTSALAEGSGLGLTIVHRIAELHGAHVELANRPEGGFQASLRWPKPV